MKDPFALFLKIFERLLELKAPAILNMRQEQFRQDGPGRWGDALLGHRSGRLSRSLSPKGAGSIFEIETLAASVGVTWGTKVPYAEQWEKGLEGRPEKPFLEPATILFFQEDLIAIYHEAMNEFIKVFEQSFGA
ncbi:MAG: hypothetical protein GY853_14625 [PVC group bacterium]|nr:hypothetical protein [PVC group bacterium]